ncbi:hypothetical protein HY78_08455 [Rhizorhabdus wittichii DC-6]|nr:hypothetical protein HY78_08455 [Rhizorhabdus wittichii DC-6]
MGYEYDYAPDEAPEVIVLWDRKPTARRPHRCDRCGEEIGLGERYESTGVKTDGQFEHLKRHLGAYAWPSHCPSLRAKELAEIAADEAADLANNPYRTPGADQ